MILRDLRDEGLFSPREPLEHIEDSKMIIQRLAQFHAASYCIAENVSRLIERYLNFNIWNSFFFNLQTNHDFKRYANNIFENTSVIEMFFTNTLRAFREAVSTWDEFKDNMDKVDKFLDNFYELGKSCYARNDEKHGYNVLNHGDFHMRNLLVKFNDTPKRLEKFNFVSIMKI